MTALPDDAGKPLNDGGSAFPNDGQWANGHPEGGMSLRDYFAAAALTGLLAESAHPQSSGWDQKDYPKLAEFAYSAADAMLRARARPSPPAAKAEEK